MEGGMKVKSSLRGEGRLYWWVPLDSCLRVVAAAVALLLFNPARAVIKSSVLLYTLPTVLMASMGAKAVVLPVLYWCTLTKNTASAMASPPVAAAMPRRSAAGAPSVEVNRLYVMGSMVMPTVRAGYSTLVVTSR